LEDTRRRVLEARKNLEHKVAGLGSAELAEGDAILSNCHDSRNYVEHLRYCTIITLQRDIETLLVNIMLELDNSEPGSHLLDVQEKLQKFQLQESQVQNNSCIMIIILKRCILQVNAMAESIKKVSKQSKTVLNNPDLPESQVKVIRSKMEELENQFKALLSLTKKRQVVLEDSISFYQLIQVR
jgi:hypothetical protein